MWPCTHPAMGLRQCGLPDLGALWSAVKRSNRRADFTGHGASFEAGEATLSASSPVKVGPEAPDVRHA